MKRIPLGLLATFLFAAPLTSPAWAAAIVHFDTCAPAQSSCGQRIFLVPDAAHDDTGQWGGDVVIKFSPGGLYGPTALGFNISGSGAVTISNVSTGFTVGAPEQMIGPFGSFEFTINGPPALGNNSGVLRFTLSREGGFLNEMDIFEMNAAGYLAGANLFTFNFPTGTLTTFTGGSDRIEVFSPVPEPGSMILLATGLAAAFRTLRRRES
jgi:hypothetical protein